MTNANVAQPATMEIVLITGMSGSGKSVALHALEDAGFYCVDNLPPELLLSFVELEMQHQAHQLAIAMDVRSATSLPLVPQQLDALRARGIVVKPLFLDATTDTLVRRYSETRRRHPLSQAGMRGPHEAVGQLDSDERRALVEAIELERSLLATLREQAHVIDSSMIRAAQLQGYVKALVSTRSAQLTLVFESFAFKRGVPTDADFVFDVRMLPNPHYEPELKALTGRDPPVADYLRAQPDVQRMLQQLQTFLEGWLPDLARDNRSYVTVAIGCTGGQHRSVYLVEQLALHFAGQWATLKRHREMDARTLA
jgi:RNase adapter protein RapZ